MKSNFARKKSSATPATKLRREIKLDESQFEIYKNGKIDILNPAGKPIDVIGINTKQLNKFDSNEDVANSLCLLRNMLLGNQIWSRASPSPLQASQIYYREPKRLLLDKNK